MSLNRAMLIGYVGHDLEELRYLPSGQPLASFSVATDESFTDKNGEKQERVDWHQVVVYGEAGLDLQGAFGQRAPCLRRRTFAHPRVRSPGQRRETLSHRNYRAAGAVPWGATRGAG
jgi:Single-strand binding protein family